MKKSQAIEYNIFEILNLRSEWEDLARSFADIDNNGTIQNLQYFKDNGFRKNRFRPGYERAMEIAIEILAKVNR
jgi:hypothetical protein